MYSPVSSPVIAYSPDSPVSTQASPAAPAAHTFAPAMAFAVEESVTLPVISPLGASVASMPDFTPPALTGMGVASDAEALPL